MIIIESIGSAENDERFKDIMNRFQDGFPAYIECGNGWAELILKCHEQLKAFDHNYKIAQIKEKFGGLRFYFTPTNPAFTRHMGLMLTEIERSSYLICEACGQPGNLRTQGKGRWMKTLCLVHGPEEDGYVSASTISI